MNICIDTYYYNKYKTPDRLDFDYVFNVKSPLYVSEKIDSLNLDISKLDNITYEFLINYALASGGKTCTWNSVDILHKKVDYNYNSIMRFSSALYFLIKPFLNDIPFIKRFLPFANSILNEASKNSIHLFSKVSYNLQDKLTAIFVCDFNIRKNKELKKEFSFSSMCDLQRVICIK